MEEELFDNTFDALLHQTVKSNIKPSDSGKPALNITFGLYSHPPVKKKSCSVNRLNFQASENKVCMDHCLTLNHRSVFSLVPAYYGHPVDSEAYPARPLKKIKSLTSYVKDLPTGGICIELQ